MRFRLSGNPCEQGVRFAPDDGAGGGGGSDSSDDGGSFLEDVILDLGEGPESVADKKASIFSADEGQGGDEDEDSDKEDEEGKKSGKDGKDSGKAKGKEGDEGDGDSEDGSDKDDEDQDADKKGKEGESSTIRSMRQTLRAQEKELKELRKKIESGDGKDGKGKEEEKPELTREQLAAILEEHKDEPEVILNVMEYVHKQGLKKAEAVKEIVEAQKQIATQVDSVLSKGLGEAYKPEEWQEEIDEKIPADKWGLTGNPLEPQIRRLIYIAGHFDSVVETRVKKEVAEAIKKYKETGEKVEKKRVEKINNTSVPKGASGGAADKGEKSTARSEMVAKEIGLSPSGKKLYDQFRTPKK